MKKKPGYYWRLKKRLNKIYHDGDVIVLTDFPERARVYIVHMAFSHLHQIKIVRGR